MEVEDSGNACTQEGDVEEAKRCPKGERLLLIITFLLLVHKQQSIERDGVWIQEYNSYGDEEKGFYSSAAIVTP